MTPRPSPPSYPREGHGPLWNEASLAAGLAMEKFAQGTANQDKVEGPRPSRSAPRSGVAAPLPACLPNLNKRVRPLVQVCLHPSNACWPVRLWLNLNEGV